MNAVISDLKAMSPPDKVKLYFTVLLIILSASLMQLF